MEITTFILLFKVMLYLCFFVAQAFFSGSETAITSLSKSEIDNIGDKDFKFWIAQPEKVLSTILVGTNLARVGIGVVAVSLAYDIDAHSRTLAWLIPIATPAMVLVFGEIIPKIYCRYNAVSVGAFSIGTLVGISKHFDFINVNLLKLSERIIGKSKMQESTFKSRSELKHFLVSSNLLVPGDAKKMLANIIDFRHKLVEDIMLSRQEIVAVDLSRPRDEILDSIVNSGYSRIPAYYGNLETIKGIIYTKDVAFSYRNKELIVIEDLLRPAYYFPENQQIEKLLRKFRKGHFHMALIVNEHGALTGLVTIEDIVEELVGEIWDEYDVKETNIIRFPDGSYVINANESVSNLNSEMHIKIPYEQFSTVAGWVLDLFGEIPAAGAHTKWNEWDVEVLESDSRRVRKIRLTRMITINHEIDNDQITK